MKILLKNANQLNNNTLVPVNVLIENDKIIKIAEVINEDADQVIDCQGNLLTPGLIDVHIHLREPGGEHKETIVSGTKAAARGGFTTVCSMPNTNPVPDDVDVVRGLNEKINQDAVVRVIPYAAITKGLQGEELTNIAEISKENIFAFTDDGVGIQTADTMLRAMEEAAKQDKAIVAHCEDNSLIYGGAVHRGDVSKRLGIPGIPSICESVQIARDVLLAEEANCHYHVCHVSTKESVRVIRDAKKAGIRVTAEVSPHHLILNEDDITEADPNFKMNPPLRAKADQEALLEGLLDGTIDFIATDHAPHTDEEKAVGIEKAPFGIVGLETAFSLCYTYLVKTGKITLQQLVDFLTSKPADVFNLPYGKLEVGTVADITVIDLNREEKINKETFQSKSKNTPFDQWDVSGVPVLTIAEGKVVYEDAVL
ncbi:dihydroorotase [Ornithinibacillus sp. 4-3]|uniref:Dihydroorotase n=1 Tax=Ornithinibacillus sp. 4-3 TaxID=3231488 RepID=A0AB39HUE9_9BACI